MSAESPGRSSLKSHNPTNVGLNEGATPNTSRDQRTPLESFRLRLQPSLQGSDPPANPKRPSPRIAARCEQISRILERQRIQHETSCSGIGHRARVPIASRRYSPPNDARIDRSESLPPSQLIYAVNLARLSAECCFIAEPMRADSSSALPAAGGMMCGNQGR